MTMLPLLTPANKKFNKNDCVANLTHSPIPRFESEAYWRLTAIPCTVYTGMDCVVLIQ